MRNSESSKSGPSRQATRNWAIFPPGFGCPRQIGIAGVRCERARTPGGLPGWTNGPYGAKAWHMARKLPLIEVGFQVFPNGSTEEFGAVREVAPGGRPELVVDIENAGDFVIPLEAVAGV